MVLSLQWIFLSIFLGNNLLLAKANSSATCKVSARKIDYFNRSALAGIIVKEKIAVSV